MCLNKLLTFVILILIFAGCEEPHSRRKTIIIKGSDTMVNLTQKWAEVYMKEHPGVSIQVTGGGSGTGIAALLNGTASIANISRELKTGELNKAEKLGIQPRQYKLALDGIAIVVNPQNKVDTLSIDQIGAIFSGKVRNWEEVGGADKEIVLYGRENSSGTYEYFKEVILGRNKSGRAIDFSTSIQSLQGTAALGETIARDVRGIGYGGVGYFANRKDLKVIHLKLQESERAISPINEGKLNYQAIWNGEYPLSRYLYCYTDGKPNEEISGYINFITSERGQEIVKQMEYIPLPGVVREK